MQHEVEVLAFEKENNTAELREREEEREERRLKREDAQKHELEKFKVMMKMLRTKKEKGAFGISRSFVVWQRKVLNERCARYFMAPFFPMDLLRPAERKTCSPLLKTLPQLSA